MAAISAGLHDDSLKRQSCAWRESRIFCEAWAVYAARMRAHRLRDALDLLRRSKDHAGGRVARARRWSLRQQVRRRVQRGGGGECRQE
jgi:hypothetical protein